MSRIFVLTEEEAIRFEKEKNTFKVRLEAEYRGHKVNVVMVQKGGAGWELSQNFPQRMESQILPLGKSKAGDELEVVAAIMPLPKKIPVSIFFLKVPVEITKQFTKFYILLEQ